MDDFSFATLLRLDAGGDYSEENSIIVTKVQFYAVELARNREGNNSEIKGKFKPTPRRQRVAKGALEGITASPGMEEVEHELRQIIQGNHALLQ